MSSELIIYLRAFGIRSQKIVACGDGIVDTVPHRFLRMRIAICHQLLLAWQQLLSSYWTEQVQVQPSVRI